VLASTGLFEERVLVHPAPIATGATLYVRSGDAFAWGCLAATVLLTLAALVHRRRRPL
jgi:apolipoprotein N-acyltransferase